MSSLDDVKKFRVIDLPDDTPLGSMEPIALFKDDGSKFGSAAKLLKEGVDYTIGTGWSSAGFHVCRSGGFISLHGGLRGLISAVGFGTFGSTVAPLTLLDVMTPDGMEYQTFFNVGSILATVEIPPSEDEVWLKEYLLDVHTDYNIETNLSVGINFKYSLPFTYTVSPPAIASINPPNDPTNLVTVLFGGNIIPVKDVV